jgi:hypothetical protein
MKKALAVFSGVLGLAVIVSGVVLAQSVPAGKEVIKISVIPGKKGPVEFPHAKHVKEFKKPDGKPIVCKDCHHTLKTDFPAAGETIEPCQSCHKLDKPNEVDGKEAPPLAIVKDGRAEMNTVIFHKLCKDTCHKKLAATGKHLTSCTTCHKK